MSRVWELDLPCHQQMLLLAMADHASDDGTGCYPGIEYLAWKVNQHPRTVQRTLRQLEDPDGCGEHPCPRALIVPVRYRRGGRGRATEYVVTIANGPRKAPWFATPEQPTLFSAANPYDKCSPELRAEVIRAFEHECQHCHRTGTLDADPDGGPWHVDRLLPMSEGGAYTPENVTLSCGACNRPRRGAADPAILSLAQRASLTTERVQPATAKGAVGGTPTISEPSEPRAVPPVANGRHPEEAKRLAHLLEDELRQRGRTYFARDWLLTSSASAGAILRSGVDSPVLEEALRWALRDAYWSTRLTHMSQMRSVLPQFELARASPPRAPPVRDRATEIWEQAQAMREAEERAEV